MYSVRLGKIFVVKKKHVFVAEEFMSLRHIHEPGFLAENNIQVLSIVFNELCSLRHLPVFYQKFFED